jgi:hypothetical protein
MSEDQQATDNDSDDNAFVDAMSAVAIVLFPVVAIVYWLSGM